MEIEAFEVKGICVEGDWEDGVQRRIRMWSASSGGRSERMSARSVRNGDN